jgi:iron(III) transport system substrate-binding protein
MNATAVRGVLARRAFHSLGLAFVVLAGLGGTSARAAGELNVYSSRHYDVDARINEAFTRQTGIKVNLVAVKEAAQLVERMKAEGKRSPADVLMTVDVGNLYRAKEAALFRKIGSPLVERVVPASLRDDGDLWTAISFRARVLVYNKEKVKPKDLSTYEDLAGPPWKGRLLSRSSNHVYNQSLAASLIAARGPQSAEQWIRGVAANMARKPQGGDTDQIRAVAAGVGDVAIVNTYYVARLLGSQEEADRKVMEKVAIFFPNQADRGAHVNVSGVGIARYARNVDQARRYIEFLLSPAVQQMLSAENKEYPVVTGTPVAPEVRGFGEPKFDRTSLTSIAAQTPAAVRLMDQAGWR